MMVKGRRVQGLRGLSEAWGAQLLKFPSPPSESRPELGGRHRPLATRPFPFHAAQFPIQHPSSPHLQPASSSIHPSLDFNSQRRDMASTVSDM